MPSDINISKSGCWRR